MNASYMRMQAFEEGLPSGKTLLVHCTSGARAAVATAFLRRDGYDVKYVNDSLSNYDPVQTEGTAV